MTNGAVNVSLAGGATISAGANGSSTLTLSGTQAQINAALASISYQGNANFNGADTLTVLSTDAQRRDRLRHGRDHRQLGERRAGQHRAGRADGERGHRALDQRRVSVNDVDGNLPPRD